MYGSGRSTRHEHGDVGADGQTDFIFPVPVSGGSFGFEKPEYPGLDAVSYRGIQPVSAGTAQYCRTGCMPAAVHRRNNSRGNRRRGHQADSSMRHSAWISQGFYRSVSCIVPAGCLAQCVYGGRKNQKKEKRNWKRAGIPASPFSLDWDAGKCYISRMHVKESHKDRDYCGLENE